MKLPVLLALFPALLVFAPVYAEYNPVTGRDEPVNTSTEAEVAQGDAIAKQIERQVKLVEDKHMQERVELIGNNLARVCDRKDIIYH
ncbi:MAG: hypothetical protein PHR22_04875, partial [Candidatus Omnitrophica bacterium]|nr:hypothetical protein [Candidatus Omnitrophota bacterium]